MEPLSHYLLTQAYNNGWANHRLYKACLQLTQDEFVAPRCSFFPSIKATLNHLLTVDWFYLHMLECEQRGSCPTPMASASSRRNSRSPPVPTCRPSRPRPITG